MPEKIIISTETGYFESNTEEYWNLAEVNAKEIVPEIDKLVNWDQWTNDKSYRTWKTYTKQQDNDAWMSINEELGIIEEFSFRADLREPELKFLFKMIDLGKRFDWIFMDRKGKPANPDFDEIKELIRNSNNYSFLKDPVKFIKDLDSGEIKNE